MFGGPTPPPDHCEQCKDEYEERQRKYLESMYGYGYIRKKPELSLAQRDPRAFLDRLIELRDHGDDEEPTQETLSTIELPDLEKALDRKPWLCRVCIVENEASYERCRYCNGKRPGPFD